MSQPWYQYLPNPGLWADIIMVVHALIIVFVIAMLAVTLIGGPRGWQWVRSPALRWPHLGIVLVVVVQSVRGRYCPLTYWEDDLRRAAGQSTYDASFIDYWLGQFIYPDIPSWVLNFGYTVFAALVIYIWWRWPARRRLTRQP